MPSPWPSPTEGTIPKGEYGAGEVIVWDYGEWQSSEDLSAAYERGSMLFTLQGEKLKGSWKLIRLKRADAKPQWLLIKKSDEFSKKIADFDVTLSMPHSVFS